MFYAEEKCKKKEEQSAASIIAMVNCEHQGNIVVQTVQQYLQQGKIGLLFGPKGPAPAKFSTNTFNMLNEAIVSDIRLNQINRDGNRGKRINMYKKC